MSQRGWHPPKREPWSRFWNTVNMVWLIGIPDCRIPIARAACTLLMPTPPMPMTITTSPDRASDMLVTDPVRAPGSARALEAPGHTAPRSREATRISRGSP
jgi:hypothetical protein